MKHFIKTSLFPILFVGLFYHCTGEREPGVPDPLSILLIAGDATTFRGADGSIKLTVIGGIPPYSYNWSNGKKTKDIEGLVAGVYLVNVKDAIDSTATGSITVKQPIPENAVTDIEGNVYTTVKIGDQIWMQQNLMVTVAPDMTKITSYIYNNDAENAKTFGRLYSWDGAMNGSTSEKTQGICPAGWHIPSDGEWKILEMHLGMTRQEADISNNWRGQGVGAKLSNGGESGYDALYSGRFVNGGAYTLLNQYEYIWTSTESGQDAWRRCLGSGVSTVGRYNTFPKTYAFSVRCLKDK